MTTSKKEKAPKASADKTQIDKARVDKTKAPKESKPVSIVEEAITHHIGIRELRQDASRVIDFVERGERVLITKHGKPVATINPIPKSKLQILIDAGMVTPAKKKFNARQWKPSMPPASPELIAAIIADMKSSRY